MADPSLIELLATIPDPRQPRGRLQPRTAVPSLAVVAALAGHRSLEAIAQFGRDHGAGLAHALGFRRRKTPAKSTLSEIFRAIDRDAVAAALGAWAQRRQAGADAIARDGKALKGRRAGELPGVHLLAAVHLLAPPCWGNGASLPRPTNTRPPCGCWASCPCTARWSPATPCSPTATSPRPSATAAAITGGWSKTTNRS